MLAVAALCRQLGSRHRRGDEQRTHRVGEGRFAGLHSQHAMKNIRQNLFFVFVYNFIGVPIAAGVLYPRLGILLSPMIASAAMSLSEVPVQK